MESTEHDSLQLSSPSLTADDSTTGSDISRTTTGSSGDFSRTTTGSSGEIPAMLVEVRAKCVGRNNKGVTWGFTSMIGRRKEMEDAVAVIPGFMARTCDHVGGCATLGSRTSSEISPVHFFGVSWEEDHFEAELDEVSDQTIDEIYSQLQLHDHHVTRTSSDTMPASGEVPAKLPKKMKKSASTKSPFSHFAAEDIVESRRPATVKEKKTKAGDHEDDEEVDAKADDFINRFKQQLKLQRLDSIIRYKDMINRGSDKQ